MRAFITQQRNDSEKIHSNLKLEEGELAAAWKVANEGAELLRKEEEEREVVNVEAHYLREEGEAAEAKCKKVEQQNERMRKEIEELWVGFATQNEELKGEYQKQVDDIFFFGYQYCMKKNDITQDTLAML